MSRCLIPSEYFAAADGKSLELVFADAGMNFVDQSRQGLTHLHLSGTGIFGLVQAGLRCARNDWILLIEDHGRPQPGLLDTYRAAIAANPDADLLFGSLENTTSVSPWSFACFLYTKVEYWPPARREPTGPSLDNALVRRSAMLPSELSQAGGLQFATCRRLVAAGRALYCPEAVVDHVRWFTRRTALVQAFHGGRSVTAGAKANRGGRTTPRQLVRDAIIAAHGFTYRPWRVMRSLGGTPYHFPLMALRLTAIGLLRAIGSLWAHIAGAGNSAVAIHADLACDPNGSDTAPHATSTVDQVKTGNCP